MTGWGCVQRLVKGITRIPLLRGDLLYLAIMEF